MAFSESTALGYSTSYPHLHHRKGPLASFSSSISVPSCSPVLLSTVQTLTSESFTTLSSMRAVSPGLVASCSQTRAAKFALRITFSKA